MNRLHLSCPLSPSRCLPALVLALLLASAAARAGSSAFQTLDRPQTYASFASPTAIDGGNIVGYYQDGNGTSHGFLYNGTAFTTLDDPNAGVAPVDQGTYLTGIDGGNIVGYYPDGNGTNHGFLYNGNGYTALGFIPHGISGDIIVGGNVLYNIATNSSTTIQDPNADYGTYATAISGDNIVGYYVEADLSNHGFLYNTSTQIYTTIDDPAGNLTYGGTSLTGISGGNIVGIYYDGNRTTHGFLYNGTGFTTLDDPLYDGAAYATAEDPDPFDLGTFVTGISGNNIVGYYYGANGEHGFLYNGSTFTTLADLELATNATGGTWARGISGGNIVGYYADGNLVRGFLYNGSTYATLEDPNPGAATDTQLTGISDGNIVGTYTDAAAVTQADGFYSNHGFLYNIADQTSTPLDDPLADSDVSSYFGGVPSLGTTASGISGGNIVGNYYDYNSVSHGFLYRIASGNYTTLDDPDAASDTGPYPYEFDDFWLGIGVGTYAAGISGGNIVGYYEDGNLTYHGFLYDMATNAYFRLDDPDTSPDLNSNSRTIANSIDGGNIVGYYVDINNDTHGFLYNIAAQTYRTLDNPAGIGGTWATGISGGNIVGYYLDGNSTSHGFLVALAYALSQPVTPVATALAITAQPSSVAVLAGKNAFFTVTASGTGPFSYQWYFNSKKISGATSATYTIPKVSSANVGNYTVVISNGIGNPVTSTPATLTLATAPKITTQPKALTLAYGATGNLTVAATGTPTLTYLWHLNNAPITAGNVTGINNSTLTVLFATPANAGTYTVFVSSNYGSLTSNPAILTVKLIAPKITTQPQPATASLGGTASFSVVASGSPTLKYQWTFNGKPATGGNIFGATTANLTIMPVGSANKGTYQLTITNSAASAKSTPVKLTLK